MKTKLETIDDTCNQPQGTFKKYVETQENILRQIEQERKNRIKKK